MTMTETYIELVKETMIAMVPLIPALIALTLLLGFIGSLLFDRR